MFSVYTKLFISALAGFRIRAADARALSEPNSFGILQHSRPFENRRPAVGDETS